MKKLLILKLILISLYSCNNDKKNHSNIFPETKNVICEEYKFDDNILLSQTHLFNIEDSYMYIGDRQDGYSHLLVDLTERHEPKRVFQIGQGPGELSSPNSRIMQYDNGKDKETVIFDHGLSALVYYNTDSLFLNPKLKYNRKIEIKRDKSKLLLMPTRMGMLNDTTFIALGFYKDALFYLYNNEGKIIGKIPFDKENKEVNPRLNNLLYGNEFTISPNKEYITRITQFAGIIELFEVKDLELKQIFEHRFFEPATKETINDRKYGYVNACMSNDKIFALYSGKLVREPDSFGSKEIHVYDLKGNPLRKIITDRTLEAIAIDVKQNKLYGITEIPEMSLLYFSLDDLD